MAVLYSGTSVSGYNANPPPDDGSTVSTNLITWAGITGKIGGPLNTFAGAVDGNITAAFGKTIDGASIVTTGVNYPATASDQGRLIKATSSGITITTPDAGTVSAPFAFAINNQSASTITLAGNATNSQTVDGSTSQVIQSGGSCIVKTDGTNWYTIGLKPGTVSLGGNNYGFDSAINLNLQCSVNANVLTVAVKTKAGNDPSAGDPVLIPFRDVTLTGGDPVWITLNSALSINTNAIGASLGSQSGNVPFRFWVVAFNNAGTIVLALWHSGAGASAIAINPLNEGVLQSTTGVSAGATSAGVFYTPNGTSLSSKAFRILGYLDYSSGLTTAGTYASAPTVVQLFGPGIKKPGDVVQTAAAVSTSQVTSTSATKVQANPSVVIAPTSSVNIIKANCVSGGVGLTTNSGSAQAAISRGTSFTSLTLETICTLQNGGNSSTFALPMTIMGLDAPGTTSSTTYVPFVWNPGASGTTTWNATTDSCTPNSYLEVSEIMA